jgi:hypothetical protein
MPISQQSAKALARVELAKRVVEIVHYSVVSEGPPITAILEN